MKYTPLYPYSYDIAKRDCEVGDWRASYNENVRCKTYMDKQIAQRFDGLRLDGNLIKDVCEAFGIDRVKWVLANTVRHLRYDGRFRPENKQWANTLNIPRSPYNSEFCLQSHPEIVNGLVNQYRKYVREDLGMFDYSHCLHTEDANNYAGKLLILRPEFLSDERKNGRHQLFFGKFGNGCDPEASGHKVYGFILDSGQETYFNRYDILGVADESKLPEWAIEKLSQLRRGEDETEGMVIS